MKTAFAKLVPITALIVGMTGASIAGAQGTAANGDVKWIKAPASLPAGTEVAVVQGDLGKTGPLAFRLKLPAGYKLMPHASPAVDRVVVVSGSFNLGFGEKFDDSRTIPMSTGYVHWPEKNSPYFGFVREETVIEIQGKGPWSFNYVGQGNGAVQKR
jgi:hypothetical protein